MSIAVRCGGCGRQYALNDRFAGLTVKCKQCGGLIAVPAPAEQLPIPDSAWLFNQAPSLQSGPSHAAQPTAPLTQLSSGRPNAKNSSRIPKVVVGVASTCLMIALALTSAYLRHVRRVQRRERATERQAARQVGSRNLAPKPVSGVPFSKLLAELDAEPAPVDMSKAARIFVQSIPPGLDKFVFERLAKLSGTKNMSAVSTNGEATIAILVPDVRALAEKIDFGTVTEIDDVGRRIVVRADASKLPPALPPEVSDPRAPDFYRQNLADLKSWDMDRRKHAVQRLKAAKPEQLRAEISAALLEQLQSESPHVRAPAVEAVSVWSTADEAVPALIAILGDGDFSVERAAVEGLGRFKDARAVEPLLRMVDRHGREVVDAWKQIGPAAEPILLEHVDEPDERVRRYVIQALGAVGSENSEAALARLSASSDHRTKSEAEQALGKIRQRGR